MTSFWRNDDVSLRFVPDSIGHKGSGHGLLPVRSRALIAINDDLLSRWSLRDQRDLDRNSNIFLWVNAFKKSFAKCPPFCLALNVAGGIRIPGALSTSWTRGALMYHHKDIYTVEV